MGILIVRYKQRMIVRQIKIIKQNQHILQSLKEVDQEVESSQYQEQARRTLNPQNPQSEHSAKVVDNFMCEPSTPFFQKKLQNNSAGVENSASQEIMIMIPEPHSIPKFMPDQSQQQTFRSARQQLNKLAILYSSINIKRYSNCVIVICDSIANVSNSNEKYTQEEGHFLFHHFCFGRATEMQR